MRGDGRELFAILSIDMVGYSRLIGLDDLGTVERLHRVHDDLINRQIVLHRGRLVQIAGDSFMVIFDSIIEAVRCAAELQRQVPAHERDQPADRRIRFRIGIEIGDLIADGAEFHGEGMNIAARLQTACPPGGICISGAVHENVKSRVDVTFESIGALSLKNIAKPVEAFVVRLDPDGPTEWNAALASATSAPFTSALGQVFPRPAGGPPLLAVLPFEQFDGDTLPWHVVDGMVTDIVCQIAGLRDMSVISHGSTSGFRGTVPDPRYIGRRLGAHYVVRGTFRHAGSRSRLITELTDVENGAVVWARSMEVKDLLAFENQDRVVGQILNTLAPRVQENELRRIRGKRPKSLSVYEKVLLARENMLMLRRDGFAQAKGLLDEVMSEEPGFAEAYALAADWHGLVVGQGWSSDRAADVAAVDDFARQALLLDGDNVRALVCYGHRKALLHRDYPAALEMFRRALDVAPSSAHAWLKSSYTFAYVGEANEAVRRADKALELSPCDREGHLFCSALCVAHYTAGNYGAAAEWGLRTLGEKTMLRSTAAWAAASLAAAGRLEEAQALSARTKEQWPHQHVHNAVARHPYQDPERRNRYGEHLLAAGFPP